MCPTIAIAYIDSYCVMNKICATHIWMFMLPILDVFIDYGSRSNFQMDASVEVC
jgi:hypothetical protein